MQIRVVSLSEPIPKHIRRTKLSSAKSQGSANSMTMSETCASRWCRKNRTHYMGALIQRQEAIRLLHTLDPDLTDDLDVVDLGSLAGALMVQGLADNDASAAWMQAKLTYRVWMDKSLIDTCRDLDSG